MLRERVQSFTGLGWTAAVGVAFITVSLVTLAFVPIYMERQHIDLERQRDILDAIFAEKDDGRGTTLDRLQTVHAQQATRVEQYVTSEDRRFLDWYRDLLVQETELLVELGQLNDVLRVSRAWAEFRATVDDWRVHHAGVMRLGTISEESLIGIQPESPAEFLPRLPEERRRYDLVRDGARSLELTIVAESHRMVAQIERQENVFFATMVASGGLAVLGVLTMLGLGRHFRSLAHREAGRRREAVEARRESKAVLEATGDGVIGVDLRGVCMFVNSTGARLLGFTPAELKGRVVHDRIHDQRPDGSPLPAEECVFARAIESGEPVLSSDEVFRRADGSRFPVQLSANPMHDGPAVIGAVLTFTDLTEIRAAEKALQDAVRAREEVLAVVSHDLRNPTGTIGAAAELLLDVPVTDRQRREHLSIIHRSASRMGRLIEDLLDVARIESGQFSVHRQTEDLVELVDEAVAEASSWAREKSVSLSLSVEVERPLPARVDRHRILQVLSNLIGNAIKFTPAGGRVWVGLDVESDEVVLSVEDTGPGIDDRVRRRLFDRFWKGHRASREGIGLGLSIVEGIVTAHGGRIDVESESGEGSRFVVRLPRRPVSDEPSGAELTSTAAAPPRTE